jgi:hypothetical protein
LRGGTAEGRQDVDQSGVGTGSTAGQAGQPVVVAAAARVLGWRMSAVLGTTYYQAVGAAGCASYERQALVSLARLHS